MVRQVRYLSPRAQANLEFVRVVEKAEPPPEVGHIERDTPEEAQESIEDEVKES